MILWRLVARNLARRPLRTALTALTIAAAIMVFASLAALDRGVRRMVERTSGESVVIAFQRYKACPPYSRLPAHYGDQIAQIPHVRETMPVRFLLSSCQTTTDLVAVHGIEPEKFRLFREIGVPEEDYRAFAGERGAALVGRAMANRYGWRTGQTVTLAELRGISFVVRGIFDAPGSSLASVVLVHREFLERSINQVGEVTMFMALVDGPGHVDSVSQAIDATFASYPAQTQSGPEKDFILSNIEDFRHMVGFAQAIAWLALVLLLGAVANSMSMSLRERRGEMALLKIRGFGAGTLVRLALAEAAAVSLFGAALGLGMAGLALRGGRIAISVEGFTIAPDLSAPLAALALALGVALGLLGTLGPALRSARVPIVDGLAEA